MASTIKVDKIEGSTGSTVTVPTGQTFTITDGISGTGANLTALNATQITSGTIPSADRLPTVTVAKGGTNLSSFSAGDVLYATGATTLAKLAAGTGSDTLKMNSGGTAPEWVTVAAASSDFVNLASGAAVSGSELSVDGFYTSDYNVYKLYLTELSQTVDSSGDLYVRVNEGGSAQTDSNYMYAGGKATRVSGSGGWSAAATGWNEARFSFTGEGVGLNYKAQGEVTIHDPLGTVANKQVEFSLTYMRHDNGMYLHTTGGGFYRSTTASTGLTLYMSANDITVAHWALYGLKAT